MNRRTCLLSVLALAWAAAGASAQFLPAGVPTITLSTTGMSGSPVNLAWHPGFNQYYGGGGGSPSFSGRVWDGSGNVVQTLTPIHDDLRSFFYNPGTGQLEEVAFGSKSGSGNFNAGLKAVGLTAGGLYTGAFPKLLNPLPGLTSDQNVPAFDPARNLLYSYDGNVSLNKVNRVSRADGALVGSITIPVVASLLTHAIGYDPATDALLAYAVTGEHRVIAFSAQTGVVLAEVPLPGLVDPDTEYGLAFTNNQVFVFDGSGSVYRGYTISAVPEPGTAALLAACCGAVTASVWWRRRRTAREDGR